MTTHDQGRNFVTNESENTQNFPDNVYSRQLSQGFQTLRFSPDLEQEYRQHIAGTQARYQKLALLLVLAIWAVFAVVDVVKLQVLHVFPDVGSTVLVVLLIRWVVMAGLVTQAAQLFWQRTHGYSAITVAITLFILGCSTALLVVLYRVDGQEISDSVLLLLIIAAFFPLGLSVYGSIFVCLLTTLATGLLGLAMLEAHQIAEHIRLILMLLLAVVVGAVGGYIREHLQREQFLLKNYLSWQADHDPMTGLSNRRSFNQHLDLLLRQAQRDQIELSLVMVDIDHFKLFNDTYGHPAGDKALQKVGGVLKTFSRRPLDMAVRVGGEEFALLLYATSKEQLADMTQQLLSAIAALNIPHNASVTANHLTASVGGAIARPDDSHDSLYQRADASLYQAKLAGRNRAMLA